MQAHPAVAKSMICKFKIGNCHSLLKYTFFSLSQVIDSPPDANNAVQKSPSFVTDSFKCFAESVVGSSSTLRNNSESMTTTEGIFVPDSDSGHPLALAHQQPRSRNGESTSDDELLDEEVMRAYDAKNFNRMADSVGLSVDTNVTNAAVNSPIAPQPNGYRSSGTAQGRMYTRQQAAKARSMQSNQDSTGNFLHFNIVSSN